MAESAISQTRRIEVGTYAPPGDGRGTGSLDAYQGAELERSASLLRLGTTKLEGGATAEAEDLFRQALETAERALGADDYRLVPALTSLARARMLRSPEEANPLVTRALSISERQLGDDNPDLVILLNDLTRLYLGQSAYALAEPLLVRLLDIKRSKGDDHPEVATVLASLAAVRQALGRHEAAEQLWRRVVEIRERVLAPNHFAIATAVEHLASTCAARGKISEAVGFYQRALAIRALTLGADHPSLRTARERIADLQLQASDGSLEADSNGFGFGAVSPWPQLPAPDRLSIAATSGPALEQVPTPRAPSAARSTPAPASASVREKEQKPVLSYEPATNTPATALLPGVALASITPLASSVAVAEEDAEPEIVPYRDVILAMKQEIEEGVAPREPRLSFAAMLAPVLPFLQKKQTLAVAGGVLLVSVALFAAISRASGAADSKMPSAENTSALSPSVVRSVTPTPVSRPANTTAEITKASAATESASTSKSSPTKPHAEERSPARSQEKKADAKAIAIPNLPQGVMGTLDSVAGVASASVKPIGDQFSIRPEPNPVNRPRTSLLGEPTTSSIVPTHARAIGDIPTPRYPTQLAKWGVGGEVRTRFTVDASGRPVMSTFSVIGTPNPQLKEAVRQVIEGMRFEPARAGGTGAPTSDVIEIGFQFAPPSR